MALNVTTAVFRPGFNIATASPSLVQWDQGQVLKFEGVELPSAYQVEFTNAVTVQAITMIGNENGVEIPNELLQQSFPITAYIVLHETAEDRETEYWATIYVKARQKPREETPDPEQTSVIDQTIAALQDGVAEAQAAANEAAAASQAVQDMGVEAETLPEGSAATVEKTVDLETGAVTLTYGIPKGAKGDKGDKGNTGETYMLAPSVDTIVKNPNTGTFIPAQIIFTVYKVVNGTSSPYRAAAIVADIFGMGMVPHYEVVSDYRLTVPINSIADTGYVACSAYGNGGIIATITIPCILDGAKGDPGEGVAPGGTTGQFLKKKSGTDYDTEWADVDPGVTSVNGKTGAVTLTASDVGAKPASYEAPVSSVNEKTGAVVLDAGDIGYDGETTYPDASVGKELWTINSALTSLSAVTEIIDTASGAIASFPDGSGLPMRSLVAQINPVQDLHGQSSPWPAGGGVNKLPLTLSAIKSANTSGTWNGNAYTINGITYTITEEQGYVSQIVANGTATGAADLTINASTVLADGTYIMNGCPSGGAGDTYYLRSTRGITGLDTGNGSQALAYSSGAALYLFIHFASGTSASNLVFKPMIRLSSVSDATFAPYSNECPISGWTGLQGQRTGANLFGGEKFKDAILAAVSNSTTGTDATGKYVTVAASAASNDKTILEMPFKENTQYTFIIKAKRSNANSATNLAIEYTDGAVGYVSFPSGISADTVYTFVLTTAANKTVKRIYTIWGSGTAYFYYENTGLFEGALTVDDFVPYTGEAISVSFPSTIYGGTDDVISGTLISKMGMVDLGTLNWAKSGNRFVTQLMGAAGSVNDTTVGNIFCSRYESVTNNQTYGSYKVGISVNNQANTYVGVYDPTYTDAATFKSAMSGVQFCYELLAPQTITHDPVALNTLYGANNIWVDVGSVSVEYPADTKLYIDGIGGTPDEDMIANDVIASGKYFMVNNKLYKSTASIAKGAQIIPNTNCTETNLVEALNALM